jgi:hypothetical protein
MSYPPIYGEPMIFKGCRMPPFLIQKLEHEAEFLDCSWSDLMREILVGYFKDRECDHCGEYPCLGDIRPDDL